MNTTKEYSAFLKDLAPLADMLTVREFSEEGVWTLQVEEETMLILELEESGRLVLSAEVGQIPAERASEFYECFMQYNNCWKASGGMCMSVEGKDGPLIQHIDMSFVGLDVTRWNQIMLDFISILRAWREILQASPKKDDGPIPMNSATFRV